MAVTPEDLQAQNPQAAGFFMPGEGYEQREQMPSARQLSGAKKLLAFVNSANIAEELDEEQLAEIGLTVTREFEIDESSRSDWLKRTSDAMKLAAQVVEEKSFPWPNAANVKFPLMTTAAIQFNARAYPAIIQGREIVKGKVLGQPTPEKKQRAERVARHMSYQLTDEMPEWEDDTDKLLLILPIVGSVFRKSYYSPTLGRNCSELVLAQDLVVNYQAKSMERAPRITHCIELYPHEITERQRTGVFLDIDLGMPQDADGDDQAPHRFLEQHRLLDLDDDGYPEPYCVTVHEQTAKVVRITARYNAEGVRVNAGGKVARVEPIHYFTHYRFMPSEDGGFYGTGLGRLLGPLNESVNTVLNQLLDAGTLQNVGGGFIGKGLRMKGGPLRFTPGEWKPVDSQGVAIAQNVFPLPAPGPSAVLFNLLGLLVEAGREIASIKDVMTGDAQNANAPATTTLALIEQGMKVYSAIFKRIHRALKQELQKLFDLNAEYLNPQVYFTFLDQEGVVAQADYSRKELDVLPVSDPTEVSEAQRLARAQALLPFAADPQMNGAEIKRRYLEAIGIEDVDGLFAQEQPTPPEILAKQAELDQKADELRLKEREIDIKEVKAVAEIQKIRADALKSLADAEAAEVGSQMQVYRQQLDTLTAEFNMMREIANGADGAAGVPAGTGGAGMAPPPGNEAVPGIPGLPPGMVEGAMGAGGGELPPGGGGGAEIGGLPGPSAGS